MHLWFRKQKKPRRITFLELYGYQEQVYRVTGWEQEGQMRYTVEITRAIGLPSQKLVDFTDDLWTADALARELLDAGARPGELAWYVERFLAERSWDGTCPGDAGCRAGCRFP